MSLRTTAIALEDILDAGPKHLEARKTKIVCTLGPACWSDEGLAALLDAGLNVARFNFSHGDHKGHLEVSEGADCEVDLLVIFAEKPNDCSAVRHLHGTVLMTGHIGGAECSIIGTLNRESGPKLGLRVSHLPACVAQVLKRLRGVASAKGRQVAYMLDTKGPEIRTAMLKGGQDISLSAGQEVLLVAVGHAYKTWEGGPDPNTGERKMQLLMC